MSLHSLPFGVALTTTPDGAPLPDGAFFVPAAVRNAPHLLDSLRALCARAGGRARLLEIASGSGQHAEAIAPALAAEGQLESWAPSDADARGVVSCDARRAAAGHSCILPARLLDVLNWPALEPGSFDIVFACNLLHISPVEVTEKLCEGAGRALRSGGLLAVYGPFLVDGEPTTPSNAAFDNTMKGLGFGLRDVAAVAAAARAHGFGELERVEMPANNFLLVAQKL